MHNSGFNMTFIFFPVLHDFIRLCRNYSNTISILHNPGILIHYGKGMSHKVLEIPLNTLVHTLTLFFSISNFPDRNFKFWS